MRYLLDTHIWLWSAMQPDRISRKVAKVFEEPANELWLSPVSVWELVILCRKGRFLVEPDINAWVAASITSLRLTEAPFTVEVALAISSMQFSHADPADHFLAATARVFDLTLISADDHLVKLPGIRVFSNH